MESCDIIIIGGGPAGSSCAWRLRRHGLESLILDAQEFPRTKLCAGWITPAVVKHLDIRLEQYPHGLVTLRKIHFEYQSPRRKYHWPLPTLQYSIRRCEFDHWLLIRSGARILKHTAREIRKEPEGYVIDDRFRCRHLVGAGGTQCPVYRAFFRRACPRSADLQIGTIEEEFEYPGRPEECRLWFLEDGLPGYSWHVPKANGWVNVGIGAIAGELRRTPLSLKEHWNRFTRRLADQGLIAGHEYDPGGHTYFMRSRTAACRLGNSYLVGDAAGLATNDLAEGIGPAVESGLRAADAIATGKPYSLAGITRRSWPGFVAGIARSLLQ